MCLAKMTLSQVTLLRLQWKKSIKEQDRVTNVTIQNQANIIYNLLTNVK